MQQLLLQGKAAMTFNGTWLLPQLQAGSPTGPFDLHVAPPPLVDGATTASTDPGLGRLRAAGHARREPRQRVRLPASTRAGRRSTGRSSQGLQAYSPIAESNVAIENEIAQEFLPMFEDAITPLDWLWEPEITAEIDSQVQALVKGDTDPASAGAAIEAVAQELRSSGPQLLPLNRSECAEWRQRQGVARALAVGRSQLLLLGGARGSGPPRGRL